ncbi:hypothetical protein BC834DRAFT_1025597 [Gloeopeniophorella convolvens]|nr:hypothetical protein BC834DRAFT_1025597 [Gloeopeniophorella convolvens]
MPLDGHSYLVGQGWSGTGSGLRKGAISRPITIPQKRTLAGIGKDRDEAFPFWDHVFEVAASAIQFEYFSSDDEDGSTAKIQSTRASTLELKQTSTGILSNRAPVIGAPASSGATTPSLDSGSDSLAPRLSLIALAKKEAARRSLYSGFFRGPVLGPDDVQSEMVKTEAFASPQASTDVTATPESTQSKKKRKLDSDVDASRTCETDREERKRQKRLRKEAEKVAKKARRRKEKGKDKQVDTDDFAEIPAVEETVPPPPPPQEEAKPEQPTSMTTADKPDKHKEKKKKKRSKEPPPDGVNTGGDPGHLPSADERTLGSSAVTTEDMARPGKGHSSPTKSKKRKRNRLP